MIIYILNEHLFNSPVSMQHFKFQCIYLLGKKLKPFMMVIDIKKGVLMLCSLKDGYNKLNLRLRNVVIAQDEITKLSSDVDNRLFVEDKPSLTIIKNNILFTFWFHDLNAKQSALMCIQQIQKPNKAKKVAETK